MDAAAKRMRALDAVRAAGGIARGRTLVTSGHTQRTLRELVDAGHLVRIRRVWVAVPDADPHLVAAARDGVVISCVTAARRRGVWVLGEGPAHVAADPHGASVRLETGGIVHWAQPLVRRSPDALVDELENALALVIACRPEEEACAVLESALRQGLVERDALLRMPLTRIAREIVQAASPWSDSGLESFFIPRLRWMRLKIVPQAWILGHRVDFLIGERLIVQIDGGHHVGAQREADNAHDAALTLLGYHVIRVGYGQVVRGWPDVQALIMRAVAQGLHLAR
jgi:very-short-patch-repair endonuclease